MFASLLCAIIKIRAPFLFSKTLRKISIFKEYSAFTHLTWVPWRVVQCNLFTNDARLFCIYNIKICWLRDISLRFSRLSCHPHHWYCTAYKTHPRKTGHAVIIMYWLVFTPTLSQNRFPGFWIFKKNTHSKMYLQKAGEIVIFAVWTKRGQSPGFSRSSRLICLSVLLITDTV